MLGWAGLLGRVGRELNHAVAAALGQPEDHFDAVFAGEPHWFGKLIRYVGHPDDGPAAQGVGPHADWGFRTLLLQDGTGGLQARPPRSDGWVDVAPVPLPPALAAAAPGVSQHAHNALLPRLGDNALKGLGPLPP